MTKTSGVSFANMPAVTDTRNQLIAADSSPVVSGLKAINLPSSVVSSSTTTMTTTTTSVPWIVYNENPKQKPETGVISSHSNHDSELVEVVTASPDHVTTTTTETSPFRGRCGRLKNCVG